MKSYGTGPTLLNLECLACYTIAGTLRFHERLSGTGRQPQGDPPAGQAALRTAGVANPGGTDKRALVLPAAVV